MTLRNTGNCQISCLAHDKCKVSKTCGNCMIGSVCCAATFRSDGVAAVTSSDIRSISSFDWHPSSTSRMLAISHSGQVADVYLRERIAMVGANHIFT